MSRYVISGIDVDSGFVTAVRTALVAELSDVGGGGGGGSGTVTSVALTAPSFLSVAGSPVTTAGTLALTLATQVANAVFAGPSSGADAAPTFRALVAADIPDLSSLYPGTVTSVDLSVPAVFSVSGNPVTTAGTLAVALVAQNANKVWAGPTTGADADPTFRLLVAADVPTHTHAAADVTSGTFNTARLGSGTANASKLLFGDSTWDTLVAADIPDLSGTYALASHTHSTAAITSGVFSAARLPSLDAITAPAADVTLNSHKITNLTDPTSAQDAATKSYVDGVAQGLDVKASVRAASTANLTLSNTQTVDGVVLVAGNRVLVKNQTTASENGLYTVVAGGAWTRTADADASAEVTPGLFVFVEEGTVNGSTAWTLTTAAPVTLGTTGLTFSQFSGAGTYTATNGIQLTGTAFSPVYGSAANTVTQGNDVRLSDARTPVGTALASAKVWLGNGSNVAAAVAVTGDVTIDNAGATTIGAAKVTNSMLAGGITASNLVGTDIATVGTVTAGTWSATTIALNKGGTGQTTALAARGSAGLNVESLVGRGDANYTITATDRFVATNANFTAPRVFTLPAANSVNPGGVIVVSDQQGTVTSTNTLTVQRAGTDTVNGGTSVVLNEANGVVLLWSNGAARWTAKVVQGTAAGTNTGDVTLAGETYLSIAGQVITAAAVNLSGTQATGTLAAGRFPALTGDVTSVAGALATTIAAGAVTDAKITGPISASKLPSLDGITAPAANVSLNSHKITNLTDPTGAQDAATKAYVDATAQGLDVKGSVRAATTAAGTLATSFENGDVIDGVTLVTGDRILLKNQATASENGIYTVNASGAPTRAADADGSADVTAGLYTWVEEGTVNADTGWLLTTNGTITLGTTGLTFAQFAGVGTYTASNGIQVVGTAISPVYGTTSGTICQGNDSRLSDARTPVGTALTSANVWLGSAGGVAAAVAVTGDVTIGNTGVTAIGAGKVTNTMLAGSVAASKLVGTDIATVGTLTAGATGAGFTIALTTSTLTGNLPIANLPALNGLTAADVALADTNVEYNAAASANRGVTMDRVLGFADPSACQGRLTLTTATGLTTADVTGVATLYFTPFGGNRLAVYDGTRWKRYNFAEVSIAATAVRTVRSTINGTTTNLSPTITAMTTTTGLVAGDPVTGTNVPAGAVIKSVDSSTQITLSANATGTTPGTGGTPLTFYYSTYDVYVYDNAGTLTLESDYWTSDSARHTALTTQDGVYVKTGATTRRYLGTVRLTGSATLEDSDLKRFVWNCYNRRTRRLRVVDATTSWTTTSGSFEMWHTADTNRVQFVRGVNEDQVQFSFNALHSVTGATSGTAGCGIGVDSTTASSAGIMAASNSSAAILTVAYSEYLDMPAAGFHYLQLLQLGAGVATTFYGNIGNSAKYQYGAQGSVQG